MELGIWLQVLEMDRKYDCKVSLVGLKQRPVRLNPGSDPASPAMWTFSGSFSPPGFSVPVRKSGTRGTEDSF